MWRADGVRGLFKGNGLNCIRIFPNSAIKFLTYEQLSRKISHHLIDQGGDGQLTPLLRLAAGAGAGIVGMSATYPLDMVRGRITIQESGGQQQYRGMLHATRVIVAEEGVLALWRGWLPSVIGVVPYVGLNFAVYETLKDVLIKAYGEGPGSGCGCGCWGGVGVAGGGGGGEALLKVYGEGAGSGCGCWGGVGAAVVGGCLGEGGVVVSAAHSF